MSLKSDKNNGYFTWIRFHIYDNISPNSSSNNKNILDKIVDAIKIHILYSIPFFKNREVYEVISEICWSQKQPQITSQYGANDLRAGQARPHASTHMQTPTLSGTHTHAHTHSHKISNIVVPRQQWLRERISMLRYKYISFIVDNSAHCIYFCLPKIILCVT